MKITYFVAVSLFVINIFATGAMASSVADDGTCNAYLSGSNSKVLIKSITVDNGQITLVTNGSTIKSYSFVPKGGQPVALQLLTALSMDKAERLTMVFKGKKVYDLDKSQCLAGDYALYFN